MVTCRACNYSTPEPHPRKPASSAQSVVTLEYSDNNETFEDLKTYLITKFAPSSYGIQNCEEMYRDFEEASRSAGELAVLSPANFILEVNQLAKTCWNKQVGPDKMWQKWF